MDRRENSVGRKPGAGDASQQLGQAVWAKRHIDTGRGDRLDVLFNPMGKNRYTLLFRGVEGRVACKLDASEAENFIAVLKDMKGDDNWETTVGQSTAQ